MYYQNLFNEQYINQQNYRNAQEQQFQEEQQKEFYNMLKSLNDFMEACNKIAPQYQEQAFNSCIAEICRRIYGNNK